MVFHTPNITDKTNTENTSNFTHLCQRLSIQLKVHELSFINLVLSDKTVVKHPSAKSNMYITSLNKYLSHY